MGDSLVISLTRKKKFSFSSVSLISFLLFTVFSLSGEFRFDVVASKASSRMYVMFHEPLNHHLLAVTEIGELIVWEDMGQGECVFQRKLGIFLFFFV